MTYEKRTVKNALETISYRIPQSKSLCPKEIKPLTSSDKKKLKEIEHETNSPAGFVKHTTKILDL